MELLIYTLSSILGGFALGFIFLRYFFMITRSHVYMAVIGLIAYLTNLFVSAYVAIGSQVITTGSIVAAILVVITFTLFIVSGYLGRALALRLKRKK